MNKANDLKGTLNGKAAELCLANTWNHSVTTTKYIEYITQCIYRYSFYHAY